MIGYLTVEVPNHLLMNQRFGRLACALGDEVSIVLLTYLYDGQHIYGHTREGAPLMRQNPSVCFEVDEIMSPTLWGSVVIHGTFEGVMGDDRLWILQQLEPHQPPLFGNTMSLNDAFHPHDVEAPYRKLLSTGFGYSPKRVDTSSNNIKLALI